MRIEARGCLPAARQTPQREEPLGGAGVGWVRVPGRRWGKACKFHRATAASGFVPGPNLWPLVTVSGHSEASRCWPPTCQQPDMFVKFCSSGRGLWPDTESPSRDGASRGTHKPRSAASAERGRGRGRARAAAPRQARRGHVVIWVVRADGTGHCSFGIGCAGAGLDTGRLPRRGPTKDPRLSLQPSQAGEPTQLSPSPRVCGASSC